MVALVGDGGQTHLAHPPATFFTGVAGEVKCGTTYKSTRAHHNLS